MSDAKNLVEKHNICYLPLENFSPELHTIINLRNLFGLRSPVHSFAKLINPAACQHMIVPTFHPSYKPVHQEAGLLLNEKNMAIFKGDSGEAERRPNAILSVDYLDNGTAKTEKWQAMMEISHHDKPQTEVSLLLDVWRKEKTNDYSYHAIIGTCALVLHLCRKVDSQEQALQLATELWQHRNKKLL